MPCGIVDEENGALHITFGSSYKTSDFIVDTIEAKWEAMAEQEKAETSLIQIKMDNGPESSGRGAYAISRDSWRSSQTSSTSRFSCCTIRRITANIIRLKDVGVSWSCSGTGRS